MGASQTWLLCDASGASLAELTTAAGKQLPYRRNTYAEAQCAISHDDETARLLFDALTYSGTPQLKVWRHRPGQSSRLIFRGWLAPFQDDAEESSNISLVFRSPFWRLLGDGSGTGRFTAGYVGPLNTDAGLIAKTLVDTTNADSPTGLAMGLVEPSKVREREYQWMNVGEAVNSLSSLLDGFDFDERFVDDPDMPGVMALLDLYSRQGVERPEARFEYGEDTLRNVTRVGRTWTPPVNVARVIGANGSAGLARNTNSVLKHGEWWAQESMSDEGVQANLDDRAQEMLRPEWSRTVSFTPDPRLAPSPWDDYWLGDTVPFMARRGALAESVNVRVNGITVVVDEEGNEAMEIPDPTTPEEEATIRASLQVEIQ